MNRRNYEACSLHVGYVPCGGPAFNWAAKGAGGWRLFGEIPKWPLLVLVQRIRYLGCNTGDVLELGRILFDGSGNLSGIETVSADGTIIQNFSFTGNYTVNSDCTGSATFLTNGAKSPVNLIVTANGTMAQYISTLNGFSVAGTLYQIGSPPQ
jgi:hypothetical protein